MRVIHSDSSSGCHRELEVIQGVKILDIQRIETLTQDQIAEELIEKVNQALTDIRQEIEKLEGEMRRLDISLSTRFPANKRLEGHSLSLILERSQLIKKQAVLHEFQQRLRTRWRRLEGIEKAS
ncbi:MAG: hypothetical protein WCV58_02590 [Patescibacteria group bacterium]|jgi:hypothetical protein